MTIPKRLATTLIVLLVLPAATPTTASPALEEALRSGDLTAAREAQRESPAGTELGRMWDRARVDLLAGETPRAIETLERLVEADPESSEYRLWYSRALFARASEVSALRRPLLARHAIAELEASLELDPLNDGAAIDLILVHLRVPLLGKGRRAAASIVADLESRRSSVASFARGVVAYEGQQWRAAEKELAHAAGSLEDPRRALFWLGYLYQGLQRWDAAFATHQKLLELSPNDPRAWYEVARTADLSGRRVEQGREMLRRYVKAELPSGSQSKDEARALLETLERGWRGIEN